VTTGATARPGAIPLAILPNVSPPGHDLFLLGENQLAVTVAGTGTGRGA